MERCPLQEGEMTHRKLTQRGRPGLLRAALVLLLFAALPVSGAVANHTPNSYTNHNVTITDTTSPQTWTGVASLGANTSYDFGAGEPCFDPEAIPPDALQRFCDITLLHVNVAPSFWDTTIGGVRVSIAVGANDYDLQIYESNASATRGAFVGQSGNPAGLDETFLINKASGYYLVQVIYFATTPADPYDGTAEFVMFTRSPVPPDVDNPPGLQDFLASDPSAGFRSYSEPHIAQNPLNPNMLIAGSKFYNKDPDSLAEYEFKIGSFVSFDGGRDWTQLGQIKVCPLSQAPPTSWPNNTCYPQDVPNQEGPEEGGPDIGEEYITSDIWMQFDDEGNAYAMVLDAPPFPSGNGWGMTLHKWESVSPSDVVSGNTWSNRIPINSYPGEDPFGRQDLFLDDKNTFAVNNAGTDDDGQTGDMVACWGHQAADRVRAVPRRDRGRGGLVRRSGPNLGRLPPGHRSPRGGRPKHREPLLRGVAPVRLRARRARNHGVRDHRHDRWGYRSKRALHDRHPRRRPPAVPQPAIPQSLHPDHGCESGRRAVRGVRGLPLDL